MLITAALEPQTGFLWNIQGAYKAPPTSRPPPSPRPAPPKLQSGNTDNNETGQKNSGISEMFCLGYRMDESGRNRRGGPLSPHTRDRAGGLRCGHCFGMREIEGRERRLRIPAPTRSWNTPCSARAYPVLEAQPSRTWASQSLESHMGVGGRRVSEVFSPAQG